MSELSLKKYDMDIISDAVYLADKTNNVYFKNLIEVFIKEKEDLEFKNNLYEAIVELTRLTKNLIS